MPAIKLRRMILRQQPFWIEVLPGKGSCELNMSWTCESWPKHTSPALLRLDFSSKVDTHALGELGYFFSEKLGCFFKYINPTSHDGRYHFNFKILLSNLNQIGFQLWGFDQALLLEDISFKSIFETLRTTSLCTDIIYDEVELRKKLKALSQERINLLSLMMNSDSDINDHIACGGWYKSMQNAIYKKQYEFEDAYFLSLGSAKIAATIFYKKMAMLNIPDDISTYFNTIGNKSRNIIRKCQKEGYIFKIVDPDDFLDDILAIRTSMDVRQGKPIAEYLKIKPKPKSIAPASHKPYYGRAFYGLFKDSKLVAYLTLSLYGELCQVDNIFGHGDHFKNGVMYLLVYESVGHIINKQPWIKCINYLFMGAIDNEKGTRMFKEGLGFSEQFLVLANNIEGTSEIRKKLDEHYNRINTPTNLAPIKKDSRPKKKYFENQNQEQLKKRIEKHFSGFLEADSFILPEVRQMRFTGGFSLTRILEINLGTIDNLVRDDFENIDVLKINNVTPSNFIKFITQDIKLLKDYCFEGTYVVFDFFCDNRKGVTGISDEVSLYVQRRFKSLCPSLEQLDLGWKKSGFLVVGIVSYDPKTSPSRLGAILILKRFGD